MTIMFADSVAAEVHPEGQATVSKGDDWRKLSECQYEDPELFFPIGTGAAARKQEEVARKVCQRCPVRDACLGWALDKGVIDGVWGGLTANERAPLYRIYKRKNNTPGGSK